MEIIALVFVRSRLGFLAGFWRILKHRFCPQLRQQARLECSKGSPTFESTPGRATLAASACRQDERETYRAKTLN